MKHLLLLTTAFSCFASVMTAQVQVPETGRNYQILNPDGYAFSFVDNGEGGGSAKFAEADNTQESQSFQFLPSGDGDGTYNIKLVSNDYYVCKITSSWNTWDISFESSLPSTVSNAKYTIEALEGTEYVGIKCANNSKYWGWDTSGVGNGIYTDKSLGDKGKWKLVEVPLTAEQLYDGAKNRLTAYLNKVEGYPGMQSDISDFLMKMDDKVSDAEDDAVYMSCIEEINNYITEIDRALSNLSKIEDLFDECTAIAEGGDVYPGFEALNEEYQKSQSVVGSNDSGLEDYLAAYNDLKAALQTYYRSQMAEATEDKPADLSYLITNPNFRDTYSIKESTTATTTGWSTNNTNLPGEGTDIAARSYEAEEGSAAVTCFNIWSWQFNQLETYQDLVNLPEGKYQIECKGYTGTDEYYRQHAFATSSSATVTSPYASSAMSGAWETLRTSTILVADGKLRIGFNSPKSEDGGSKGWFRVTGFKLLYVGGISDTDIDEVLAQRVAYARGIGLTLKGDKAALDAAVSDVNNASTVEQKKEALAELNEAITVAESAKSEYDNFVDKTLAPAKEEASAMTDADMQAILTAAIGQVDAFIGGADSKSDGLDSLKSIIAAYKKYIAAYEANVAPYINEDGYTADSKKALTEGLQSEKSALVNGATVEEVEQLISQMNDLAAMMRITKAAGADTDYSFLITNPDIAATDDTPEGWTISTNGNNKTNTGESFIPGDSERYLDSYESTKLDFTASQTIENVPNGTYKLVAAARASTTGAYLYAQSGESTKVAAIEANGNLEGSIYLNDEEAEYNAYVERHGNDSGFEYSGRYASTGWGYVSLDIEVKDHKLTIGVTNDVTITGDTEGFNGTWFSADKFQLFYTEAGDNTGWAFVTAIDGVKESNEQVLDVRVADGTIIAPEGSKLYSLNGAELDIRAKVESGLYIVKNGNKVKKIIVR